MCSSCFESNGSSQTCAVSFLLILMLPSQGSYKHIQLAEGSSEEGGKAIMFLRTSLSIDGGGRYQVTLDQVATPHVQGINYKASYLY